MESEHRLPKIIFNAGIVEVYQSKLASKKLMKVATVDYRNPLNDKICRDQYLLESEEQEINIKNNLENWHVYDYSGRQLGRSLSVPYKLQITSEFDKISLEDLKHLSIRDLTKLLNHINFNL